ncbi:TolB-like translocation protein [Nocardioides bizhenqiangii]|uniref:WD40 repeat domain-containing protein n=1 Tax=Nocardioides bizhenqiangii TaxID=3095076 RepID=A0ABZ0ZQJ8_9ACTN|nr:hypothetical protein [Nocardioides sp. HM61]WQQ25748.1 hypothetical protein SHK19_17495 [Nocardioides sp. HM61]
MNHPTDPTNPAPDESAWEVAMSRDFDARVRDLHEAPLDITSVKGKAHKIKRNRRAAVAGGVLGVAAIVTPIAVLANSTDDAGGRSPEFVEQTTDTAAPPANPDYLQGTTWHQADGDTVELDHEYQQAVQWGDRLVGTRSGPEVYLVTEVLDEDGNVIESMNTTSPVAINDTGTTIAWVEDNGQVMTAWDGGETAIGSVELAAPGETIAWTAAAISGGPDCNEDADGCVVYLNSNLDEDARAVSSDGINDIAADGAKRVFDSTSDGAVSVVTEVDDFGDTCGGIYETQTSAFRFETCDYQVQQFSPNGDFFIGTQSQFDGAGPSRIALVDAADGQTEVNSFERDGWIVGDWTWSPDGAVIFTAYEGGRWHLMAMTVDGDTTELAEPVRGDDFATGFRPIRH